MRLVFLGSPDFAVPSLQKILTSHHEVIGVVTQPDRPKGRGNKLAFTPVKELALAYSLPLIQPRRVNNEESLAQITAWQPDILVVVAFGQLLKAPLLELAPLGAVNLHASLLPAYRGAAPIHWAIINGERETGVTTMRLDLGMDTGDMILKARLAIGENEDTGSLYDRLKVDGAGLLLETLDLIEAGRAAYEPQDGALASYAPLLKAEDELIDWQKPAFALHNQIRGLSPTPGAYTQFEGKRLKIRQSVYRAESSSAPPGTIIEIEENIVWLAAGEGRLGLIEVQPEGKTKMPAVAFARGKRASNR
ncbi:MAG: methionyl-tRNA formyltransferase [Clostridiales bacterium]|jgi:methionyl-tRNA formyltransferase|nr:methionyl-tRNA formyltransferase [Clostridiales bacterium]